METARYKKRAGMLLAVAALAALLIFLREPIGLFISLCVGGLVIAFVLSPLCNRLARHMPWKNAVPLAFVLLAAALVLLVGLLMPPLIRQLTTLINALPDSMAYLQELISGLRGQMETWGIPGADLPEMGMQALQKAISPIMNGTFNAAGNAINGIGRLGLMLFLSYYFLKDKQRLQLMAELAVPCGGRRVALKMAETVKQDLNVYLRGQMTVSLLVGMMTAVGLLFLGESAFLVLGLVVGVMNLVPYFGPILGGIPAVIMALSAGWSRALATIVLLFAVQQIDGMIISPAVMGSATRFSPALVLVFLTLGGSLGGMMGMLLTLPVLIIVRGCFRVWVQKDEIV